MNRPAVRAGVGVCLTLVRPLPGPAPVKERGIMSDFQEGEILDIIARDRAESDNEKARTSHHTESG